MRIQKKEQAKKSSVDGDTQGTNRRSNRSSSSSSTSPLPPPSPSLEQSSRVPSSTTTGSDRSPPPPSSRPSPSPSPPSSPSTEKTRRNAQKPPQERQDVPKRAGQSNGARRGTKRPEASQGCSGRKPDEPCAITDILFGRTTNKPKLLADYHRTHLIPHLDRYGPPSATKTSRTKAIGNLQTLLYAVLRFEAVGDHENAFKIRRFIANSWGQLVTDDQPKDDQDARNLAWKWSKRYDLLPIELRQKDRK